MAAQGSYGVHAWCHAELSDSRKLQACRAVSHDERCCHTLEGVEQAAPDLTARCALRKIHAETYATRNHRDLLRLHFQHAQFGRDAQRALLRHDQ